MTEIIYWKKFYEPNENGVTGEYVCNDERVDKVWFTGSASANYPIAMTMWVHFLFKDGQRFDKQLEVNKTPNDSIRQAEEYLKQLK